MLVALHRGARSQAIQPSSDPRAIFMTERSHRDRLLVTDFDGTMTRRDFYSCVVERLLSPEDLTPWQQYAEHKLTHFEALRQIFERIRVPESHLDAVFDSMEFDPRATEALQSLRENGWEVIVVSNGCRWYIDRFFAEHQIEVEVHSNPGTYSPETGLQLRLPVDSPFFSQELGISKLDVVRTALSDHKVVAFAGDGRPDLDPALLVPPQLRFAREWLADALDAHDEGYTRFEGWSEISTVLCEERRDPW